MRTARTSKAGSEPIRSSFFNHVTPDSVRPPSRTARKCRWRPDIRRFIGSQGTNRKGELIGEVVWAARMDRTCDQGPLRVTSGGDAYVRVRSASCTKAECHRQRTACVLLTRSGLRAQCTREQRSNTIHATTLAEHQRFHGRRSHPTPTCSHSGRGCGRILAQPDRLPADEPCRPVPSPSGRGWSSASRSLPEEKHDHGGAASGSGQLDKPQQASFEFRHFEVVGEPGPSTPSP
jgi:hypothetical protein